MFSKGDFEALAAEGITRAWYGIGGSHTFVTYPPLDALRSTSAAPVVSNLAAIREFNLYVHLPFCEMACPFCPYERHVVTDTDGVVETYLRSLTMEMELIARGLTHATVESLYIGGGTATVLSETQLERLLNDLRSRFSFTADSVVCIETSPNALIHKPSKIALMKRLGVKRVSAGVQTFAESALRTEGRTHSPLETLQILERLVEQMDVVNVDLMQDMPGQTDDDLAHDIDRIAKLRPAQVTWYIERLRKWHGEFPDPYRSVSRRLWVRDRMKALGYTPRPGGRFVLTGSVDDSFKKVRCGLESHLIGLGASAYGHVPGYFYRNAVATASYQEIIGEGRLPISTGVPLRKVDMVAGMLASGIRWGVVLPQPESDLNGYLSEAMRKLDILTRHDVVRFEPHNQTYQITLDGPGWAYEEEICSLFVPQDVVDEIRGNNLPWWC